MHPNVWAEAGSRLEEIQSLLARLRLTVRSLTGQSDPLSEHGIAHLAPTTPEVEA